MQTATSNAARVLIVEDDAQIGHLIEAQLRLAGHRVAWAPDAESALGLVAERGAPDVAVLDVGLPDKDGLELSRDLRAVAPDLPVVFLSARVLPEDIESGRLAGGIYLTKPYVASALLGAIDRARRPREVSW